MKGVVGKVKPPIELLTETTQPAQIPNIPAGDNNTPSKPFFRVAAPPAATQDSALQEELADLLDKLGRGGTSVRRPHLESIPEELEDEDEDSETEEMVDGGGEISTPEVVEGPSQVPDRSEKIPTMPFFKTRSGRVSQPTERLSDFMALPVEFETEEYGAKSTVQITNEIKDMLLKLQCMGLPREIQNSCVSSSKMESLPTLGDLEQLLIDVGESTRVDLPETTSIEGSTIQHRELSDLSWPTLRDSHTGGKSSRVGRAAPGRVGYKGKHMDRCSPIRVCRITSESPTRYTIPKLIITTKTSSTMANPSSWVNKTTRGLLAQAMRASKVNGRCRDCSIDLLNEKAAQRHVTQHYYRTFCECGYNSRSRDMVLRHQRLLREQGAGEGHGGDLGQPFDVDSVEERIRTPRQFVLPG
jgi:hypothetical protein